MNPGDLENHKVVCVHTDPGICGFTCTIKAWKSGKRMVGVDISGSECKQVKALAKVLKEMSLKDVFTPLTRNPAYSAAEKSGCHPSCVIPAAILKAVEIAMEMALPKEVGMTFKNGAADKEDCETEEKNELKKCRSI